MYIDADRAIAITINKELMQRQKSVEKMKKLWNEAVRKLRKSIEEEYSSDMKKRHEEVSMKIAKLQDTNDWQILCLFNNFISELGEKITTKLELEKLIAKFKKYSGKDLNVDCYNLYMENELLNAHKEKASTIEKYIRNTQEKINSYSCISKKKK